MRKAALPKGIRNNNPGNIRATGIKWDGMDGKDDDGFATFEHEWFGLRALARNLKTYRDRYGLTSVAAIISRWAPDNENDTGAYVQSVAARLQVTPNQVLTPGQYPELVAAIVKHENGMQPYSMELISDATAAGLA